MSDISITRDELSRIANGNQRTIRAFEKLFKSIPEQNDDNTNVAETAISKSNQAISSTIKNEKIAKGSRVLTWLSMT